MSPPTFETLTRNSSPGFQSNDSARHLLFFESGIVIPYVSGWQRRLPMADTKGKVKDKIDQAADKAKDATDKAVDKTKDAAQNVGQKVKDAGQKIKDQGK
jgi:hypothetical protein